MILCCKCMIFRSIGASLDTKTREKFAVWAEQTFDSANCFPRNGSVFDGYIDFKQGAKWRSWDEIVPPFTYLPRALAVTTPESF